MGKIVDLTRSLGASALASRPWKIVTEWSRLVAAGFHGEQQISLRATQLTYLSLLSVVPLLAVVLVLVKATLGDETQQKLQQFILDNIAVGAEGFAEDVPKLVNRAHLSAVGGIGFFLLVASTLSLLWSMEAAFNAIFHAEKPRTVVARFVIYWCILTLGPLLLGASLTLSTYGVKTFGRAAGTAMSLFITWSAFATLYILLPNTQVLRRGAITSAIIAGSTWEAAKIVYGSISKSLFSFDAMYGALGAIPVFLIWTYVSWLIVLFGARVAYAAQAVRGSERAPAVKAPRARELWAMRIMLAAADAFDRGAAPPSNAALADRLSPRRADCEATIDEMTRLLAASGLLREAGEGWLPARPPDRITLRDVREAVRAAGAGDPPVDAAGAEVAAIVGEAEEAAGAILALDLRAALARATSGPKGKVLQI